MNLDKLNGGKFDTSASLSVPMCLCAQVAHFCDTTLDDCVYVYVIYLLDISDVCSAVPLPVRLVAQIKNERENVPTI